MADNNKARCPGAIKPLSVEVLGIKKHVDFFVTFAKGNGYSIILGHSWLMQIQALQDSIWETRRLVCTNDNHKRIVYNMKEQGQEDIQVESTPSDTKEEFLTTASEEEDSDITLEEDSSMEVMGIRIKPINKDQAFQVEEEVKSQEQPQENNEEMIEAPKVLSNAYTLFFDGSFRRAIEKAGGGLVLVNPEGEVVMKEWVTLDGSTSNNEAQYDVLISCLKICLAQKIQRLKVKGDTLLIVKQILGYWACKNERLRTKLTSIRKIFSQFEEVQLYHNPRKENEDADSLAQQAVSNQDHAQVVIATIALKDPHYAGMESLAPMVNYILEGEFPKEFTRGQGRKLIKQASTFLWLEGALYQKGKDLVCRRVPSTNEIPKILKGLHEEACRGHFSFELTLKKVLLAGFGTPLEIVSNNGPGLRRGLLMEVIKLFLKRTTEQAVLEPREGDPKRQEPQDKQKKEEEEQTLEDIHKDPTPPSPKSPLPLAPPAQQFPQSLKSPLAPQSSPKSPSATSLSPHASPKVFTSPKDSQSPKESSPQTPPTPPTTEELPKELTTTKDIEGMWKNIQHNRNIKLMNLIKASKRLWNPNW
ncbi:hypothetical protein L7F22_040842 [Adiantum nelumboides]|nr:hypothetical protein [Adiantum nelumboides]